MVCETWRVCTLKMSFCWLFLYHCHSTIWAHQSTIFPFLPGGVVTTHNISHYRLLEISMGYYHPTHRYLMSRLSLQVFYLWRHVLSTAPPFILGWSNLEILFAPLHRSSPFIRELLCQAIQTEHGPYIAERTQNAVYIVRCLWSHSITDEPISRRGVGIKTPVLSLTDVIYKLKGKVPCGGASTNSEEGRNISLLPIGPCPYSNHRTAGYYTLRFWL
jgi:hypothetical protein